MKINWIGSIFPVIVIAVGVLWILQGTDSLGQEGGMNGNQHWTLIGIVAVAVGIGLLVYKNRGIARK